MITMLDVMKLPKARWVADVSLVALGVCLILPVYVIDSQYAHAHAAASKAYREAQVEAGDNYEKYSRILTDKTRDLPSPETYYRRKEAVGRWTVCLFLLPLLGGLAVRRWVASTLVFILWMLSWSLQGLRY